MTDTWKPGDKIRTEKPLDTTGIICRFFVAESSSVEFAEVQCLKTGIHYFVKTSELPILDKGRG